MPSAGARLSAIQGEAMASKQGRTIDELTSKKETHRSREASKSGVARHPVAIDEGALQGTRFRPLFVLGGGGMGEIYEAEDTLCARRVVVKVLRRGLSEQPGLVDRMRI